MSIKTVADLYMGDHAPEEAAERLEPLVIQTMPSDPALGILRRAWWLYRIAARMGDPEELEVSTRLIGEAKETCRQAALVWLDRRGCPCCIALKAKLERMVTHD
jgi:hypothetical protein